jgi:hypothetical protein
VSFQISWRTLIVIVLFAASVTPWTVAQQPAASIDAVLVLGMGLKDNSKGRLEVTEGALRFQSAKNSAAVSVVCIEDVVTSRDSERILRGPVGTLSMLAPYGGGRALSLMRTKLDTITIEYRDSDGALHGAIFTMHPGDAEAVKAALLAHGAHTSIPPTTGSEPSAQPQPEERSNQDGED